jgi:hypothetical protein
LRVQALAIIDLSVLKTPQKPAAQPAIQVRGRPRLGSWRLETVLPAAALEELKRREAQSGVYRTRICARILIVELVGTKHLPPS